MKRVLVVLAVLLIAAATAQAQVLLSEDWESGRDGWTDVGAAPALLSNAQNATPGGSWSLKTNDLSATNSSNALDYAFAGVSDTSWICTFKFFDTGATREFIQLRNYNGTSVVQNISFGTWNTTGGATSYYARIAVGGGDWAVTTAARKLNEWHDMKITQDGTTGLVSFWVDGALANERTTTSIVGVKNVRVGSSVSNGSKGAYFDDVTFRVVPEPSSMLALASGLIGMAGFAVRRRKA